MTRRGRVLASQEIRRLVERGIITGGVDEDRIQPASFEPTIGNEVYIIDTGSGLFRPSQKQTVWRTILEIPQRQRQRVDITEGFETKVGSTYAFPLEERIRVGSRGSPFRFAKSSPKSSLGRVFPANRLMTDYNSSFDEVSNFPKSTTLRQWLLFQPLAFNLIVGPGLSFNQSRFFSGYDAALSPSEVLGGWEKNPLLYSKDRDGNLGEPVQPRVTEALGLHLDLEGKSTEGIVALRARRNPEAVDLRSKGCHVAEEYFEPIKAKNGKLTIRPGEHLLLSSDEVLNIPPHLNIELRAHSHHGLQGALHRAGFADPGFVGDLVFEVTSYEQTDLHLAHGDPLGELTVSRNTFPDKLYGTKIGSHYHSQTGPKVAKYFYGFDFNAAAKNSGRMNRDVLVQERGVLLEPHGNEELNFDLRQKRVEKLFDYVENGFFHSRYDCEDDPHVLQIVPYILLFDNNGKVFSYVRRGKTGNKEAQGDQRLYGKYSIGIGGHILQTDFPNPVQNSVSREIEKDVHIGGSFSRPKLVATLYSSREHVDRHHFGLVYASRVSGSVRPKDNAMEYGDMISLDRIVGDPEMDRKYETWSQILIPHLDRVYDSLK